MEAKYKDREWLKEQHHSKERTPYDIADELDVARTTIVRWLEQHDIEFIKWKDENTNYRDEEWLEAKYVEEGLDKDEIADLCDVQTQTIRKWLIRHQIDERSNVDEDADYRDKEWLKEQHHSEGKSLYQISRDVGEFYQTIKYWVDKFGIEHRKESGGSEPTESDRDFTAAFEGDETWRTEEWLRDKYDEEGSVKAISERDDVSASRTTIARMMDENGIEYDDTHSPTPTTYDEEYESEMPSRGYKEGVYSDD